MFAAERYEMEVEWHSRDDYIREAYAATAEDCRLMGMQDLMVDADEAAAESFLAGEITARELSDLMNEHAAAFGG